MRRTQHIGVLAVVASLNALSGCSQPEEAPEPTLTPEPATAPGTPTPPAPPAAPPTSPSETNPWAAPTPVPPERPRSPAKPAAAAPEWQELAPGVRVDRARKIIEVEGKVPIDAHDADAPVVYLEAVACTPDTKEHESLVVIKAPPSRVHAALLLLGLEPGRPGWVGWDGQKMRRDPSTGPAVRVRFRWKDGDGKEQEASPAEWVLNARSRKTLAEEQPQAHWVFAGSRFATRKDPETGERREVYDADFSGTFIGLHTFGGETLGWSRAMSPDSGVETPEWIADARRVPKVGTPVTVIIEPVVER